MLFDLFIQNPGSAHSQGYKMKDYWLKNFYNHVWPVLYCELHSEYCWLILQLFAEIFLFFWGLYIRLQVKIHSDKCYEYFGKSSKILKVICKMIHHNIQRTRNSWSTWFFLIIQPCHRYISVALNYTVYHIQVSTGQKQFDNSYPWLTTRTHLQHIFTSLNTTSFTQNPHCNI